MTSSDAQLPQRIIKYLLELSIGVARPRGPEDAHVDVNSSKLLFELFYSHPDRTASVRLVWCKKAMSFNKPIALICLWIQLSNRFSRAFFASSVYNDLYSLNFCTACHIAGCRYFMYICIHYINDSSTPLAHKVNVIFAVGIVSLVIVYVGYSDDSSKFLQLL